MMASRKAVLDKNKQQLLDSVNASNKIYNNEELSILLVEQQQKNEELTTLLNSLKDATYNKSEVDQLIESKKTADYTQVIDLRSGYNENIWYPVASEYLYDDSYLGYRRFRCISRLTESGNPSWSTHSKGFSVSTDLMAQGGEWGGQIARIYVLTNDFKFTNGEKPVGYYNYDEANRSVFYLRGGGRYVLHADYPTTWKLYTSKHVFNSQYNLYVEPLSSYPGITSSSGVITIQ